MVRQLALLVATFVTSATVWADATNMPDGCTIEKFTILSPSMGREIKAVAVLPPGYAEHPERKYPVLYAFHGYDAPYTVWSDMSPLRQALQEKPMVVVSFDADRGSWYLDSPELQTGYLRPPATNAAPAKSLFTTFFFDEFIPAVDQRYRINSRQRMLTGFSMGGFGALHYLLTKPDQFVSVSSLSGAFTSFDGPEWPRREKMLRPLLGTFQENRERYRVFDLYARLQVNQPLPPLYLHCGTEDSLLAENRTLHEFLQKQGIACEYLETPGAHNWKFWKEASAGVINFHWKCLSSGASTGAVMKLSERKSPPVIILKLDDLSQKEGTILPNFRKMAELLEARQIKGSFGVILAARWPGAQSLPDSGPEYVEWVKKLATSGRIEFWFHGWDHSTHDENGEAYCEFNNRTYEEQKQRFDRSQKIAREKLGFTFQTFGPGGGNSKFPTFDETTLRVLADDPHIKTWLCPKPLDEAGRKLESGGKVTILDRVMDVNLERKVGEPDFNWFLEGYSKHPDREYFVLQGHPNTWDDAKFSEVLKIIDFLIQQKATFMTPTEYAAIRKASRGHVTANAKP
jgi:S-formylglutathione hydrolase FrmB